MKEMSTKDIVHCEHITVKRGDFLALDDVSFRIQYGEYVGIVGPNGAGKTTLLLAILGIISPNKGFISLAPDVRIGYVPQKYFPNNTFPVSVSEIVAMGFGQKSFLFWKKKEKEEKIKNVLESVGLSASFMQRNFNDLSGGQKQRVIIARALVHEPNLLLFDEPTSGVDHINRIRMYELLAELNKQKGITILFVSHEIEHVVKMCKRILCLDRHLHEGCTPMEFLELGSEKTKEVVLKSITPIHHTIQTEKNEKHTLSAHKENLL
ncbi:MAG: ABC transporter ATP-binding protein [Candidatus Moraniibacteriota bacterium]|nr:MAG: ABC transporter ATP-binding protein [Candidatus Moranbacteria bacterium]